MTAIPNGYVSNVQAYPSIVSSMLGFETVNDTAIAGWRIDQLVDSDSTNADPLIDPGKTNVLCVFAGSNDFGNNFESLITISDDLRTYCSTRRSAGWDKIIVASMLPRDNINDMDYPNFESDRLAFNTWLRLHWTEFADGLVDIALDSIMGDVANINNTTYYADGVHPTVAGHAILAQYFYEVLSLFIN